MLWEVAYAELMFVDVLWPEFRRQHLHDCLDAPTARASGDSGSRPHSLPNRRTCS